MPRQLGTPGSEDPNQQPWFSGFVKTPVEGPIEVTPTGLVGDGQADLENHGGPDKAILCYNCLLYTSPSPRDRQKSRMPSSA